MLTYDLPNFNAKIAEEIFGIDFAEYINNINKDYIAAKEDEIITLNGVLYKKV